MRRQCRVVIFARDGHNKLATHVNKGKTYPSVGKRQREREKHKLERLTALLAEAAE